MLTITALYKFKKTLLNKRIDSEKFQLLKQILKYFNNQIKLNFI